MDFKAFARQLVRLKPEKTGQAQASPNPTKPPTLPKAEVELYPPMTPPVKMVESKEKEYRDKDNLNNASQGLRRMNTGDMKKMLSQIDFFGEEIIPSKKVKAEQLSQTATAKEPEINLLDKEIPIFSIPEVGKREAVKEQPMIIPNYFKGRVSEKVMIDRKITQSGLGEEDNIQIERLLKGSEKLRPGITYSSPVRPETTSRSKERTPELQNNDFNPFFSNGFGSITNLDPFASKPTIGIGAPGGMFARAGGGALNVNMTEETLARIRNLFQDENDTDGQGVTENVLPVVGFSNIFGKAPTAQSYSVPPQQSDVLQKKNHIGFADQSSNARPFPLSNSFDQNHFSSAGPVNFSFPASSSSGGIMFQTGSLKTAPKLIDPENMRMAMALLAGSDDEKDAKSTKQIEPVGTGFFKSFQNQEPTGFKYDNSSRYINPQNQPILHEKLAENTSEQLESKNDQAFSSKTVKEEQPVKKNPFLEDADYSALNKKVVPPPRKPIKNKFGPPLAKLPPAGGLEKVQEIIRKDLKKTKIRLSKLNEKISIDLEIFKSRIAKVIAKKKPKIKFSLVKTSRDYGTEGLTLDQLFMHLQEELLGFGIREPHEMIHELYMDLCVQLNSPDLEEKWVLHHLLMLSRKYRDRVIEENPRIASLQIQPKLSHLRRQHRPCIYPCKITMKHVLTNLYYRHKRENFYESYSVIQQYRLGLLALDNRTCLMVSKVELTLSSCFLELTDGWYTIVWKFNVEQSYIKQTIQNLSLPLLPIQTAGQVVETLNNFSESNELLVLKLIISGKIRLGDKLEVSNLGMQKSVNPENDEKVVKCEPLEAIVYYNSLRRLPVDAKMGRLFTLTKPSRLSSIRPMGGTVPLVDVIVVGKKGLKKGFEGEDYLLDLPAPEEVNELQVSFCLVVMDSLLLDPDCKEPFVCHIFSIKNSSPNNFVGIEIGQRLRLRNVKVRRRAVNNTLMANFNCLLNKSLTLYQSGRNHIEIMEHTDLTHPVSAFGIQPLQKLLSPFKRPYTTLEVLKRLLDDVTNMPLATSFLFSVAVRYIRHIPGFALFHLLDTHFLVVEVRKPSYYAISEEQNVNKEKPGKVIDAAAEQADSTLWAKVAKFCGGPLELVPPLILFYDLEYSKATKHIDYKGGKISMHRCCFDLSKDYMIGEGFLSSTFESSSLEMHLVSEYKRNLGVKLGDGETVQQLIAKVSKLPLT